MDTCCPKEATLSTFSVCVDLKSDTFESETAAPSLTTAVQQQLSLTSSFTFLSGLMSAFTFCHSDEDTDSAESAL